MKKIRKSKLNRKENVCIHNTEPARIQQHDQTEEIPKYDVDLTRICSMIPSYCSDLFNVNMFKKLIKLPPYSAEYVKTFIDHNTINELFAIRISHITVRESDNMVELLGRLHIYNLRKYQFTRPEDVTLEKLSAHQFGPAAWECAMRFHFYKIAFDKGELVQREARVSTVVEDRENESFLKRLDKWSENYLSATDLSDKCDQLSNSYLTIESIDKIELVLETKDDSEHDTVSEITSIISKEKVEEFFAEEGALTFLKNADIDKFLETVFTALNFQIHNLMRMDNMQAGKYNLTPPDLFDILKIVKEPNKFTVVRKGE